MSQDKLFLPPQMPHLRLDVIGTAKSGELQFYDGGDSFRVTLRGRVWELFEVLLLAQLDSTQESPHGGFRNTDKVRDELIDQPLPAEVARRVDRLRGKLAKSRFGSGRPRDSRVTAFRMAIIETTALGYRLSVPRDNIIFSRIGESSDVNGTPSDRFL